jgi:hypothetical protein
VSYVGKAAEPITMSKKKKGEKGAKRIPKRIGGLKLPKELRQKGEALLDRATSPEGQAALAKGLTIAASLATAAAERRQAKAAPPAPPPANDPHAPVDPAKVVETVATVANEVLGRLFGGKKA